MKKLLTAATLLAVLFSHLPVTRAQDTPGTVKFPAALDTADSLIRAKDNAQSTLAGAVTSSTTSITVADGSKFPASGVVVIDSEVIFYTGKSGNTLTGAVRGREGTTAASHSSGVLVRGAMIAAYHNTVAAALVAAQVKIGAGSSAPAALGQYLRGTGAGSSAWSGLQSADVLAALGFTPLNPANNLGDLLSPSTARTNLGMGTLATQNSNALNVTGGNISGVSITGAAFASPSFTGNVSVGGSVTATSFSGNGSGLTGVVAAGTGGTSSTGALSLIANSDNSGADGLIDFITGSGGSSVTRMRLETTGDLFLYGARIKQQITSQAAPFVMKTETGVFNGTRDDIWFFGYNEGGAVAGQPVWGDQFESNFHPSVSVNYLERHFNYTSIDRSVSYRPWGFLMDLNTNDAFVNYIIKKFEIQNRAATKSFNYDADTGTLNVPGAVQATSFQGSGALLLHLDSTFLENALPNEVFPSPFHVEQENSRVAFGTSDFSEPLGGSPKFKIDGGVVEYNFGSSWFSFTDNTRTGIFLPNSSEGVVFGSFSNDPVTIRIHNNGWIKFDLTGSVDLLNGTYKVLGNQVLGPRCSAITNATDSTDAVAKLNALLTCARSHGFVTP